MSVQIIDNFKLNVSLPIDNRLVVGGDNYYQTKEDIEYVYPGLRIWDLNTHSAWIWSGIEWISEVVNIEITATDKFITKVQTTLTGNKLVNSIIYEENGAVGIDTINIQSGTKLQVNGIIRTTSGGFYGNGANLTDLDASKITSGVLPLSRLSGGGVGNVLMGSETAAQWVSVVDLFVNDIELNQTNSIQYLLFTQGTGNNKLRINNTIRVNPNTNNVSIGTTSLNNRLTVAGSVSIGTASTAPSDGLLVQGQVSLNTVNQNNNSSKILAIDENNIIGYTTGGMLPIGSIVMWFNSLIPNGWVFCDGSSYNTEIGQITTPDLRERFIVGASSTTNVPGAGYIVGDTGGQSQVTLQLNQIPSHTHNLHGSVHQKQEPTAIGQERLYLFPNGPTGGATSTVSSSAGENQPHENRPPYYALAFIMYVGSI